MTEDRTSYSVPLTWDTFVPTISFSRAKAWGCPAHWRRVYLLGERDPDTPATAFGSAVHAEIEARWKSAALMGWQFDERSTTPGDLIEESSRALWKRIRHLRPMLTLDGPMVESRLVVQGPGRYQLEGRVDLLTGRGVLVDYKTQGANGRERPEWRSQMTVYAICATLAGLRTPPFSAEISVVTRERPILTSGFTYTISRGDMVKVWTWLRRCTDEWDTAISKVSVGGDPAALFPRAGGEACRFCPNGGAC